jgi:hypothetical protein
LKSDSIQQMLRKPASFNAFAKHTGELCPDGLCLHILPDASSSLHVFSGFWLDLRSSVRQWFGVRLFYCPATDLPVEFFLLWNRQNKTIEQQQEASVNGNENQMSVV